MDNKPERCSISWKYSKFPCCLNTHNEFLGAFSYVHLHLATQIFKRVLQTTRLKDFCTGRKDRITECEHHLTETIRLNRLRWFGHAQGMSENRTPKRVLYMNLGTTRLRGRPRNRWQNEVREDGRLDGGEGWQEKVHNREEWKKFLRTARNRHILHMPMEWMNDWTSPSAVMVTESRMLRHVEYVQV